MSFLRPEVLPWLWTLTLIPLLYLVRRRARKVEVPHLFLWDRVLKREGKTRANRIRNWISMALQMLIAASLILAWAGPIRSGERVERGRIMVLLDVSSTMSARREDGRRRLEAALAELQSRILVWSRTRDVAITLVADGSRELVPFSSEISELSAALDSVPDPQGTLDLIGLRQLIRRLRADDENLDLVYLGDGAVGDGVETVPDGIGFLPVGDELGNLGILSVELLKNRSRNEARIVAEIAAFSSDQSGIARLETAEGGVIASQEFSLRSGQTLSLSLSGPAQPEQWISLRLLPREETEGPLDALGIDDEAAIWLPASSKARILIASEKVDPNLKSGLGVLGAWVDLESASQVSKSDWRKAAPAFDFVVLQDLEESRDLQPGKYLLLNSWAPNLPLARSELVRDLAVVRQERGAFLLRGLDLRDLNIDTAWRCEVRDGAVVVLEGTSGALISRGAVDGVEFVHFAFSTSVSNSSLALLPAWPLLLKDLVEVFGRDQRRVFPEVVLAGQPFVMNFGGGAHEDHASPSAQALEPAGQEEFALRRGGPSGVFLAPILAGGYEFRFGERQEWVAVNQLGASLSDIRPRWTGDGEPQLRPNRRLRDEISWAPWVGFLVLLLLLLEWAAYQYAWIR